jgi:hypothetical protein
MALALYGSSGTCNKYNTIQYDVLGCDSTQSGKSSLSFWRNSQPPFTLFKIRPRKQSAGNRQQVFDPEDRDSTFL